MVVIKQGGSNPYAGQVNTTMGMRDSRAPVCWICHERKTGQLYTFNSNGQLVCADCSGSFGRGVLRPDEDSSFDVGPEDTDT